MGRMTLDDYFTQMASLVSRRGTCPRRQVGAVLTNGMNHVVATGYNGPPRGMQHCVDVPCAGASAKSGEGLDLCEALHAEQNSLLQCKDVNDIETLYSTDSPCVHCTKLLLNTSCKRIVFLREYPHPTSRDMWLKSGRQWVHYEPVTETSSKS